MNNNQLQTWWLSFIDPDKPQGSRFLGVSIVDGIDFKDAHQNSWILECNPGGEVEGYDISFISYKIKPEYKNRLLSKKELDEANFETY